MKSFYHYLAESVKLYQYRIKSIKPMDKTFLEIMSKALFKYDLQTVGKPKKLMAQKTPLDFKDFPMSEVWVLDIETRVPASSYVLATQLRSALELADKMLVVRGKNEPIELEAEKIEQIHKDEEAVSILQDPMYENEEQPKEVAFGDSYNRKLLDYLAQSKANAEAKTVPAIEEVKKTQKFAWLNPKDKTVADDFNDGIDGVKPVHVNTKKDGVEPTKPNLSSPSGNYDENVKRKD